MKRMIFVILILSSCQGDQSELESILTDDKACWVFHAYPDEIGNYSHEIMCSKFYKNGTFQDFFVDENGVTEMGQFEKGLGELTWSVNATDSVFMLGDATFRIIKYNQDTLVFRNEMDHVQRMVRVK